MAILMVAKPQKTVKQRENVKTVKTLGCPT